MATRHERVIVDLDDRFTRPMAGMAASAALFRRNLDDADRNVITLSQDSDKAGASIDRFSGRLQILANVAGSLGPALVPVSALAIPAVTGLAAQFGFAAVGAGTALAAFQGVGDTLEAVNKAALEPTAKNLDAARMAMEQLSPAAQDMVGQLREMGPMLRGLRDTAAAGMFPGLIDGIESLERVLPKVNNILAAVSAELGDISRDVGASLASGRWSGFLDFIATDAPSALRELAQSLGNITHGLAEMWMAFDPLNDDFSRWMVNATRDFDRWASGLSQTEGFQEFIDYIRAAGPQVASTLGALGDALVQILQAAAPIGGPVLKGIEAFAKAIAAIADSDLGTPIFGMVAAVSALNLAMRSTAALSRASFSGPIVGAMKTQRASLAALAGDWRAYGAVQRTAAGRAQASASAMIAHRNAAAKLGATVRSTAATMGKGAAAIGGLTLATSGAADGMKLTNTASLALMGLLAGPWGAAVGGAVGLTIDMAHAGDDATAALDRLNAAAASGNFSMMTSSLAAAKKQLTDLKNITGAGDLFETIAQDIGLTFQGKSRSGAIRDYERAIRRTQQALKDAKAEAAANAPFVKLAASIAANRNAARQTARQFITLGDSLNDGKVGLRGWLRELEQNAKALTEFGNNARRAANRGLRQGLIKALQEAGPEGARRMAQLANASQKDIGRANRAWAAGQRAIQRYTDTTTKVPHSKATLLRVLGAAKSREEVLSVLRQIDSMPRSRTTSIFINTYRTTTFREKRSGLTHGKPDMLADGGYIAGPGGPRDDVIPAWLSNGEFVVNAAATKRFRAQLEMMNAQKYATGGLVTRGPSAPAFDYDRLGSVIGSGSRVAPTIEVYETQSASATGAEVARRLAFAGGH